MSVNSVLPGLLPYYGPLSGNGSQNAQAAARAPEFQDPATGNAAPSQASARSGGSTATDQLQSTLEQALRQGGASTASTGSATSNVPSDPPSPGIAAYQRISQYGNNSEPSTSALLKRWNNIMQSGNGADRAAADFAKLLAHNEAPGLTSGVLDLTA
jgi:hypothetical protein